MSPFRSWDTLEHGLSTKSRIAERLRKPSFISLHPAGGLVDTVKDGVTGFHMGEFNADRLVEKDANALAAAIGR